MTDLARVEAGTADRSGVVRVVGEIDLSNAAHVRDAIGAAVPELPVVVLDLTGLGYLDSAGIAMLFRLSEWLAYNRQELRLVLSSDSPIRAVIRLTRLDQVVSVEDGTG